MIEKLKKVFKKRKNTQENTITTLKAELYDAQQEIKQLKQQLKREKAMLNKIRALPTTRKKELGLL